MERAGRALSEDVKVELLQLATAWMELESETGRKQDAFLPASDASGKRVRECLAHAEMCRALSASTIHPRRKAKLLDLAAKWVVLAENIGQPENCSGT